MTDRALTIDPEFEALCPAHTAEEFNLLEMSILEEGCRDAIVTWANHDDTILDGHTRYRICQQAEKAFKTKALKFDTRGDAINWIINTQLGRRNNTEAQKEYLRGKRYSNEKKEVPNPEGVGGKTGKVVSGQDDQQQTTAEVLAAEYGVSEATIRRDAKFAEAIDKITESLGTEAKAILLGANIKKADAAKLAKLPKREQKRVMSLIAEGKTITQAVRAVKKEVDRKAVEAKVAAQTTAVDDVEAPSTDWEIRHGDVLAELKKLSARSVRLIFADPPYNIGVDYGDGAKADKLSPDEYMEWAAAWLRDCKPILTDDGSLWVMIGDEYAAEYAVALKSLGYTIRSWIKWYESFGVNCAKNFNRCSRHIFYCVVNPKRFVFNADAVNRPSDRLTKYNDKRADPDGKIWDDVWGINPPLPRLTGTCAERIPDFPTQLPLDLLRAVVGCASEPGDTVVDPFSGSATTGAACIALGRKYIGIEKSKTFVKLSQLRLRAQEKDV